MKVTDQLRKAIRDSGISQYALARESGVPQPRISTFMAGGGINSDTFDNLAKTLGLDLRYKQPKRKGGA